MDDLDNTPMPPMGADDMGDDDMGGGAPPMDDPMGGGGPDDMGDDPMGGGDPDDMGDDPMGNDSPMDSEDDELMDIINSLSIEDKAAVAKYAKSMVDDSDDEPKGGFGGEEPDMGGDMPMESRRNIKGIIDETVDDILGKKNYRMTRPKKELPNGYHNMKTPFRAKTFMP